LVHRLFLPDVLNIWGLCTNISITKMPSPQSYPTFARPAIPLQKLNRHGLKHRLDKQISSEKIGYTPLLTGVLGIYFQVRDVRENKIPNIPERGAAG
jgi:hypothetical protein